MNTMHYINIMLSYDFKLTFSLPETDANPEHYLGRLAAKGCDDATAGIGLTGRIALEFSREAKSAEAAVLSALKDVCKAIPGAVLVEASPDLVGLTDIADLLGFSRQHMHKLHLENSASFPSPVHDGSLALWHLAPVLQWFQREKGRAVESPLLEIAQTTLQLNLARDSKLLNKQFQARMKLA